MAKDTLTLGSDLELPLDAVTRTIALYGQKRQGKTSTAVVLIEEATKAGACFAWIDPTGAAWGLRSSADGEGPGLDCVVMGGFHGDVPLDPGAGEVVARLVVVDGYNIVCDLKRMTLDEQVRFVGDFSDSAYHLCQRAVTVVYDEMRRFAPQKGGAGTDEAKKCLRAVSDVVMLGGHVGLGSIAIAQRMASLHKDVGEQADVVISHRLMGINDRKAFGGWLEDASENPAAADAALARLPRLKRGEAVVLAPEYELLGVHAIRPKQTFDSSGTPEVGTVMLEAPQTRAAIDLTALEAKMGKALEAAQENDPDALRRRIAKLEKQLADGGGGADADELAAATRQIEDMKAEMFVLREKADALRGFEVTTRTLISQHAPNVRKLADELGALGARDLISFKSDDSSDQSAQPAATRAPESDTATPSPPVSETPSPSRQGPGRSSGPAVQTNGDGPALKAGAKRMLVAMLRAPRPVTRPELMTLADVRGGTFSDYLSSLRQHALVTDADGTLAIADGKVRLARSITGWGSALPPLEPAQIVEPHAPKLKAGARRMLDAVMRAYPEGYTRAELSRLADVRGGTFSDYLSALRKRGLLEERNRRLYAGHVLYLWSER